MTIISQPHLFLSDAYGFSIRRHLYRASSHSVTRDDIQAAMRTVWRLSVDDPAGRRRLATVLKFEQKAGLIIAERGRGGGYQITQRGVDLFKAELSIRQYRLAHVLHDKYRAIVWPEPPAPIIAAMAA